MSHKISVIIPYYNREAFIDECLQSVFNQTRHADEIIVVDDGSRITSARYLQKYMQRIKIVKLDKNSGPAHARNVGVNNANGDLIAFLDSDDIWVSEKLAIQEHYLDTHPECKVCHTGTIIFSGKNKGPAFQDKPTHLKLHQLLHTSHVATPSLLLDRDVFNEVGGFDTTIKSSEDHDFSIRVIKNGFRIHFIEQVLVEIRRENHQHICNNALGILKGHCQVLWKHRRLYQQYGGKRAVRRQLGKYLCHAGDKRGRILGRVLKLTGILLGGRHPAIQI